MTKRFRNFAALDNVSFSVAGGVCALIGPNGAGKSTLLKILSRQLAPDQGSVRVAGFDLAVETQSLAARRVIGVVPEDLGLFGHLTVQEHFELTGPIYGLAREQAQERTESLLRLLGLHDARDTFAGECSQGTRKKTALAMALLPNPRLLLLDEPFESLDPVACRNITELLAAIARRGITVLFASHSLAIVDRLATQVILIRQGRIMCDSASQPLPRPLEELYFELVDPAPVQDLSWLG
ncbi:MAG TPA: ABC transporter ATP-binding protein [Candidatus Angelobacter sp.]